ncbi:MAG: ATP-binding cassette domain-containing protein [Ardenticatenales bacterium]|nr:ATP-binding cassette domain-containing protein [Ardenticatenales bacterium]
MFGGRGSREQQEGALALNRENLRTFWRIFQYVKPYRGWLTFAIIALTFSSLLNLVLPLVIQVAIDDVFVAATASLDELNRFGLSLLVIFLVQALFSFGHHLALAYVGEKTIADIRVAVFAHVQMLSLRYFGDNRTGELVSRLTNDVSLLQRSISTDLVALLRQAIMLIGAAILLFYLNLRLTLIILTGIPIISLLIVFLGMRIRKASRQIQDALAEAANVIEETIAGIRIVKSFAREPYEIGRFRERVNETFAAAMRHARIRAVLSPAIGFLAFMSLTVTIWFGGYEVLQGRLTPGELVAYFIYTFMVAGPVATLADLYSQYQTALGASERIFSLLDTVPEIRDSEGNEPLGTVRGDIRFEHVSFDYSERVAVLREVDFQVAPGQVVALVGPSGAGKSTLVNLIPRFYDTGTGRILIDGRDIRHVQLRSLREQIGIVPQETILFADTVFNNIRYGRLDASQADVEAAARAANAHEFILQDLPDGYQTLVGERGVKLSGGQRQRVAIARAILKDPRILILDEATSSLDSESESLVQEALERLMAGRTAFVIAHRLSTIVNADWILVMDDGRVVEQGTHKTLLTDASGLYRRLHDMQFARALG